MSNRMPEKAGICQVQMENYGSITMTAPKWNVLISPTDWPYNHKLITHLNFIFWGGLFTEGFTSKCQDKFKVMRYAESALKTCFDSAINIVPKVAWTFSLVMNLTDLYIHAKRLFLPPLLSFCKFFQYSTADPARKSCTGETLLSIVCSVTEQIYQIQSWELFVRDFLVFYHYISGRRQMEHGRYLAGCSVGILNNQLPLFLNQKT